MHMSDLYARVFRSRCDAVMTLLKILAQNAAEHPTEGYIALQYVAPIRAPVGATLRDREGQFDLVAMYTPSSNRNWPQHYLP